ncbi:MAG: Hsp20/alpha crystallin family protein [Wenzhouxiangellaceae bacterium]|nr:Hsp20/alpha crystallin family protein [Wenzhouxiangellaceae bacterium]
MDMDLQKISPWNWFRGENERRGDYLPAVRSEPLARLHREMDRMFEDFLGQSLQAEDGLLLRPKVDIAESNKAYRVSVEVPGIDSKDIELRIENDALVVSGEKRQESEQDDEGFHRVERSYGQFRRVLALPDDADPDNIEADFKNGVLKIRIPRNEESEKPGARKIEVKA